MVAIVCGCGYPFAVNSKVVKWHDVVETGAIHINRVYGVVSYGDVIMISWWWIIRCPTRCYVLKHTKWVWLVKVFVILIIICC